MGVNNVRSSNGAQAYYAERIANANFIGIVLARSVAAAAAFGGIDPVLGTNPIAFSFPTQEEPLVFDMATTAMTWYGLVLARARGEFKKHTSELVAKLKGARSPDRIRIPGERAAKTRKSAEESGVVEVDDVILQQLNSA